MDKFELDLELLSNEELEEVKSSVYFFIGSDVIGWPF